MGPGKGCTEKYRLEAKPEMLILWAVTEEDRSVMQGGISWRQGLKNYSQ